MKKIFLAFILLVMCALLIACSTSNDLQKDESNNRDGHTHSYQKEETAPTCSKKGKIVYTCSCGDTYTETIPALKHDFEKVSVIRRCTTLGSANYECTRCGLKKAEGIPAQGHSYGGWEITKQATLNELGVRTKTCSLCGDVQSETFMYQNDIVGSAGLKYEEHTDYKTAAVSLGTCTDEIIIIPPFSPEGNRVIDIASFKGSKAKQIILPETAEYIAKGAFDNCVNLTELVIPESVERINYRIAKNTPSLKTVYFNARACKSVSLDFGAFEESSVENVILGDSVEFIHTNMFMKCTALKSVTLGANVEYIYASAFSGDTSLTEVKWNDKLTFIGDTAFYGTAFTSLDIPESVTKIGSTAFANIKLDCDELVLGGSLKQIGASAFLNAGHIKKLSVKSNSLDVDIIGAVHSPFTNTTIDSLYIADNVTKLPPYLLSRVNGMTSVTLGGGLTSVSEMLFVDNTVIEEVILNENITSIEGYAFKGCSALKQVVGISQIKNIEGYAFSGCSSFKYIDLSNVESLGAAFSSSGLEQVILPDKLEVIPASCFAGCKIKNITLPDGLKTIEESAFAASAIESIVIPDSVTTLEWYAFRYCKSLRYIKLSDGLIDIDNSTFESCDSLEEVVLPKNLKSISRFAFMGCKALKEITIPDTVTNVYEGCFDGCTSLVRVNIPKGVTKIPRVMFDGCSSLSEVEFHSNVVEIGEFAFSGTALTKLVLPEACVGIGSSAFRGCTMLESIAFNNVKNIASYAFYGCTSLKKVIMPDTLEKIGNGAFNSCTSIEELYLGNSVSFVDEYAFANCTSIRTVYLPTSLLKMTVKDNAVSPFLNSGVVCYVGAESISQKHYSYFGSVLCGYTYDEYLAEISK